MKNFILIVGLSVLITSALSSCSYIPAYTAPVIQGKDIKDKKLLKIKPDMTKDEVKYAIGSPDIVDLFDPNTFIYVRIYKDSVQTQKFDEKKLILKFNNKDRLIGISGNYAPPTKGPVF